MLTAQQSQPCPGSCNRAWRAADRAVDEHGTQVSHRLRPEAGDPVWCSRCARLITARLAELDDLVAILSAEVDGRRAQTDDAPVTGTRGRPSPSPVVDDIDEIVRTLELWETSYRELRGFPPRPGRPADLRLTMCATWLTQHITGALGSPFGDELGRDILRLNSMARARCQTNPAKRRMPAPCPRCDVRAVHHHAGDGYVSCEHCGRMALLAEWETYTLELARRQASA